MLFKSEYVIAMFNNKNSRLMSRLWTFSPKRRSPQGQSPILLVEKVKKIKALGLKYPNYHSDLYQRNVQLFELCPQSARAPYFWLKRRRKSKHWDQNIPIITLIFPQKNVQFF